MIRKFLAIVFIGLLLSGCGASSHILVGVARDPIRASEVKIYVEEPVSYEKIAVLDASSKNSLAITDQGKMNVALDRLKEEAAKLGANGILLTSVNEGQVLLPVTNADGAVTYTSGSHKALKAIAIYVKGS